MDTYQLGFIGAGKLAGSVIRGLMRAKFCPPGNIIASEPNDQTRTLLQKETDICLTAENAEVAEKSEVIFLGVKPAMALPVLRELSAHLNSSHPGSCHINAGSGVYLFRNCRSGVIRVP